VEGLAGSFSDVNVLISLEETEYMPNWEDKDTIESVH
jgi:hypothetical protein